VPDVRESQTTNVSPRSDKRYGNLNKEKGLGRQLIVYYRIIQRTLPMTLIRQLFQSLISMLEKFTEEDAWVLLCAAGVNYFVPDSLVAKEEENVEVAADQDLDLLGALDLEAECPAWSWKGQTLSAGFLWKNEADLNVRDWIYLM
jgi:hypothetical protein